MTSFGCTVASLVRTVASLARTVASLARTVASLARTVAAEVSTKPLHLPPGSSAGFTRRARSSSLMDGMDGMDGVSNGSFHFLYTLWVHRICIGLLIYMFYN